MDYDVSVTMLTLNAGGLLERVLGAVGSQRTGRRVEVLAVDSGSRDGTLDILKRYGVRVLTIAPGTFNFGRTRDFAYEQSRGDVIVNLSQDAVPAADTWLERLLQPLEDSPDAGASCGPSLPDPHRAFGQFPWERNGHFYFTREMGLFREKYGRGLSFANSAVPRSVWWGIRFREMPLGEDFYLQTRLHAAGRRIVFAGDAPVLHHHDYTLGRLYRRCRDEGAALRLLGCPYGAGDLAQDLMRPRVALQWLRELRRGRLRTSAGLLFPVVRPVAVYLGSRWARSQPCL